MSDLIDRQTVIDSMLSLTVFNNLRDLHKFVQKQREKALSGGWAGGIDDAIYAVIEAPSVQSERPKGKWNTYYHGDTEFSYSCNQCGYGAPFQILGGKISQKKWNFCPNCGADMRESVEQNDNDK